MCADIALRNSDWGWRGRGVVVGDSLVSDVFSFHSDGHEDAKLGSNTDPLAPNRLLSDPSGSIDAQGECERV